MKLSLSTAAIATLFLVSSAMAAPVTETTSTNQTVSLPVASITISNPSLSPPPAATIGDTMSGTTALASITIQGHDATTAQSTSGSEHRLMGAAIALPIAVLSALTLI